jgi:hypothetical protein
MQTAHISHAAQVLGGEAWRRNWRVPAGHRWKRKSGDAQRGYCYAEKYAIASGGILREDYWEMDQGKSVPLTSDTWHSDKEK